MTEVMTKGTIGDQIKKALDGRTQRWLSLRAAVPENVISKAIKNQAPLKADDMKSIERVLNIKFKH